MTLDESYALCRRMSGRAGSSFHAGFRLLPPEKRRAMEALYAFLRYSDDLADGPPPDCPRREALAAWRAALHAALSGVSPLPLGEGPEKVSPLPLGEGPGVRAFPRDGADAILPALADAVRTFRIPLESLEAVLDGVAMDIGGERYETFDQLRVYCNRVASAVGICCIHIWGFRGLRAFGPATNAGIAFQLTNILRDLGDDAAAGRVYLPAEDLRAAGYSAEDLRAGVADERFERLMAAEVARAEGFYAASAELLDWLEPAGRRVFGLMAATYRSLLRKIAKEPGAVFRRRVRLGRLKKLQLAARWSLLPPRKAALR